MAVVGETDVAKLNGNFKERYASRIEELRHDFAHFQNDVSFVSAEQQEGNKYNQPVLLTHSHGFTYAAGDAGAFAINTPVGLVMKNATVNGFTILEEERIPYDAAFRAANDDRAFDDVFGLVTMSMTQAASKRVELASIYGNLGFSRLASSSHRVSGGGTATQVFQISTDYWATGIFSGMENCPIDIHASGTTPGSKVNTNAVATITKVDVASKRITVTGNTTDLDAVSASDWLMFYGSKSNLPTGVLEICGNTGTLFGVDGATYSLWQGNSVPLGSTAFTFDKMLNAFDPVAGRCDSGDWILYVSVPTWTDLAQDQAALRRMDASYSSAKGEQGVKSLRYFTQLGSVEVKPHQLLWGSYAFAINKRYWKRVGATDITFNRPGKGSSDMIYELASNAGYGMRLMTLQAPFCFNPASCLLVTGITNG